MHFTGTFQLTISVEDDFFQVKKKLHGNRVRRAVVGDWTGKLFKLCYDRLHLPCVWSFDRAIVRSKDIGTQGKCADKQCKATITTSLPHRTNNLQVLVKNYNRSVAHDQKLKRRMRLEEKERLQNMLRGKSAFAVKNDLSALTQDKNLPERADIPTMNALRLIKSRDQCPDNENVFDSLDNMRGVHVDCIHKIGYDPFWVIYETPTQTEYYAKEHSRKRSIISLDATGVGVKSPTSNPKCIYLYVIVVHGNSLYKII